MREVVWFACDSGSVYKLVARTLAFHFSHGVTFSHHDSTEEQQLIRTTTFFAAQLSEKHAIPLLLFFLYMCIGKTGKLIFYLPVNNDQLRTALSTHNNYQQEKYYFVSDNNFCEVPCFKKKRELFLRYVSKAWIVQTLLFVPPLFAERYCEGTWYVVQKGSNN